MGVVRRLLQDMLDDRTRKGRAIVRIDDDLARLAHAMDAIMLQVVVQREHARQLERDVHAERRILEAGSVRHEMPDADRLGEAFVGNLQVRRKVGVDRIVERDKAPLDK